MNNKLKLAMAALLGFSTACGAAKKAPAAGRDAQTQEADAPVLRDSISPRIVVMYGVRPAEPRIVGQPQPMVDSLNTAKPDADAAASPTAPGTPEAPTRK